MKMVVVGALVGALLGVGTAAHAECSYNGTPFACDTVGTHVTVEDGRKATYGPGDPAWNWAAVAALDAATPWIPQGDAVDASAVSGHVDAVEYTDEVGGATVYYLGDVEIGTYVRSWTAQDEIVR